MEGTRGRAHGMGTAVVAARLGKDKAAPAIRRKTNFTGSNPGASCSTTHTGRPPPFLQLLIVK